MAPGVGIGIWVACIFTAPLLVDLVYWMRNVDPVIKEVEDIDQLTDETETIPFEGMPNYIVPRKPDEHKAA